MPIPIPGTNKKLGEGVFVIAEIGKNFIQTKEDQPIEVYIQNAKKLIDAAAFSGVDAVKFQTHEVSDEQAPLLIESPHFKGMDRYAWVKRNTDATPLLFWREIKNYAEGKGLIFFSTPMSRGAAKKLSDVGVPLWKVGSGDVDDFVMMEYLAGTGKPVIISTGMVGKDELDFIVTFLKERNVPISVLYCVSKYPAPKESFNLASIEYLKEKYPDVPIGFSDHSVGDDDIPLAAVKIGASIIEKHFSLSRDLWGSDHKVSMTPDEMKSLVEKIRAGAYENVDYAPYYGDKKKEFEGAENAFRPYFKKTLVAARPIEKGEVITADMIHALRPRIHLNGLAAREFPAVVGKKAAKDIGKNEPISEEGFLD